MSRPSPKAAFMAATALFAVGLFSPAVADPTQVEALIAQMTLDEKLSFLHGATDPEGLAGAGYIPGVPRLNIPPLRMADGPAGVRGPQVATAFPAPVALTATFSPEMAEAFGRAVGREGLARSQNVLLAPMTNIVRVPVGGRNFETFGEDPLLAADLVSAVVTGVQAEGMIATVKHWAANNQETDRQTINVNADERTLREIEMPPFLAAVQAGAGAFMCSYNKLNGPSACENPYLLTQVLRDEWHYTGFVMSDWGGTRSTAPSIVAGLDIEMPRPRFFGDSLAAAVADGTVPVARIDESVRRILTQMDAIGLLDGPRATPEFVAHPDLARTIAEQGAVLLRNEDVLPLPPASLADSVIIGATARRPLFGGGGSAAVKPTALDNPYDELVRAAGVDIPFAEGLDFEGVVVPADALGAGLARENGGVDAELNLTADARIPAGQTRTWTGTITAPEAGDYDLMLHFSPVGGFDITGASRGAVSIALDGTEIVSGGRSFGGARLIKTLDGLLNQGRSVRMEAGVPHAITITASASGVEPLSLRLAWNTPTHRRATIAQAAALARTATTPIVFAHVEGTEGRDNVDMALPDHQDELIAAVAAANPRTVVVLNTGAPVLMPWLDQVSAVLEMWYPGQEGGRATADLLTGAVNPSGKLPVTFPKRWEDTPVADPLRFPGADGQQYYSEGISVGYRWYDHEAIEPLFPFGHGLSYTRFEYSDPQLTQATGGYDIAFTLKNVGPVSGMEVSQIYLSAPAASPEEEGILFAPKGLSAYRRIDLAPGQSQRISVRMADTQTRYWSAETGGWRASTGHRNVLIGSSSRDIRLRAELPAE